MSRQIIHGISRELLSATFCEYFGVATEHADILIILWERSGARVETKDLQRLLNSHRPPTRSAIYERVRFLREIMDSESLDSGGQLDDLGYALTEVGLEECRKALRATAEALLRNGPNTMLAGRNVEDIRQGIETSPPLRTGTGGAH